MKLSSLKLQTKARVVYLRQVAVYSSDALQEQLAVRDKSWEEEKRDLEQQLDARQGQPLEVLCHTIT